MSAANDLLRDWNLSSPGDTLIINMSDSSVTVVPAGIPVPLGQDETAYVRTNRELTAEQAQALLDLADMAVAMLR